MKPLAHTWISSKVEFRSSPIHGKGMFAKEKIEQEDIIVIWGGTYVNKEKALKAQNTNKLIMQWDEDLYSIEERGDDPSYYINHSCDPNIWMINAFTLVTKRKINKDEEITADYAFWEANEQWKAPWKCQCGSILCRHQVTGKDWQLSALQERYKGHFSPLINKLIKSYRKF